MSLLISSGPWTYFTGVLLCEGSPTVTPFYMSVNRESVYEVFETFETKFALFRYNRNSLYMFPPEPICEREILFNNDRLIKVGLYRIKFFHNPRLGEAFKVVFDDMFNNAIIPFKLKWKLFMRNVFTAKLMERMFHPKNMDKFEGWGFGFHELIII